MLYPRRKSRVAIARALSAVVLLVLLAATMPAAWAESELYYHSDGLKIPLRPSARHLAVRFEAGFERTLAALYPAEIDGSSVRKLDRQRLAVYQWRASLGEAARRDLSSEIEALPAINRILPVFEAPGALMIVTDEFVARFAPGVSARRIAEIHSQHDVEPVRTLAWHDGVQVLRVAAAAALETANAYHQLPEVLFAHPDFVRLMDRRPGPRQGRTVIAPDGALLPPDTALEKGAAGYRIVEPASAVLPGKASAGAPAPPRAPVNRTILKTEGFEGTFPNDWALYGTPTWSGVSYRSYAGSWSGYCAGSLVSPPGPYWDNSNSWMVYGPFSLTDALDARVDLQAWINTEAGYDYFWITASVDDTNFSGNAWSGDWVAGAGGDGWRNFAFDLTRVGTLGDLRGEPEVWVALIFQSDSSESFEGVYVDEVVIEKITAGYQELTSDVYDHLQWGLANNGQLWGIEGADIRAPAAWGVTHGSDTITVAVIDEGVDLDHPDLAVKMLPGYDATDGTSDGGATGDDAHGTACAGIAAALTDNGTGVAGIAREAKILPVRVGYDDGSGGWVTQDSWLADGIGWATANGADVLSNSWGGGSPATVITDAIAGAKTSGRGGLGAVVVFSAGNANGPVLYPATLASVLAVGALSPCDERKAPASCDGEYWWGSNYGAELDLMAPGVHMYTTDIAGTAGYDPGDHYYDFNGTSSAAPVVAGVAGLLLGLDPTLTAAEVETQLLNTADDLLSPGWDPETGFGRVNAFRALSEAPADCYALTLSHTGMGADPAASPASSPGCDPGEYHEGASVALTAAPDPGWTVGGWSGTDDDASTAAANTVTMPDADHTASVEYVPIPCHALTLNHTGTGADPTASPASSPGCGSGQYHPEAVVDLTAAPDPGWAVAGWTGTDDDGSTAATNTVTMPSGGHGAAVHYIEVPPGCFVLTRIHTGDGSDPTATPLSSPGCPGGAYLPGEALTLAALPSPDWTVGGWAGTADDSTFRWVSSILMPAGDHTVTVRYFTPVLVKDVRAGSQGAFANYTTPTHVGQVLYFAAHDGIHGNELWKSDGTVAGTVMVKDINIGIWSAFPYSTIHTWFWQDMVTIGDTVFFVAQDGVHDYELWKSDGTEAGTAMVKDIYGSWDEAPTELTVLGDTLFFAHSNGVAGVELWKSDGTEAGTVMVKDIYSGPDDFRPNNFAAFNGRLFFRATDGDHGWEPWVSDGTEAGTVLLKDIHPAGSSDPRYFTESGGELFFRADDGIHGLELWKTDGTEAGTVLVKDIATEAFGSNRGSWPRQLTDVGGTLFFAASDDRGLSAVHGDELWKSDGTEAGTVLVKDISPGSEMSWPTDLTDVDGTLFFDADDGAHGFPDNYELWRSDGTETGTFMVKEIYPGPNFPQPGNFRNVGGMLFLNADDGAHGRELWHSDGTEAGTLMVRDVWPGSDAADPYWPTDAGGLFFFRADDGVHGREIWALLDPTQPPACYSLTFGHTGMGADPMPDVAGSAGCNPGEYHQGTVVTLTSAPDPAWMVGSWSGTDDDASTATVNTVTMPAAAHAAGVDYVPIPCYALTLSHTGMGADPVPDLTSSLGCSAGEYHAGELVTLTANPDPGWTVSSWSGTDNDASRSALNTCTMPAAAHDSVAHYGVAIFIDGFESGDASAWSAAVP